MLFHAECGRDAPEPSDTVRLWWIPDSDEEIAKWRKQIRALRGRVLESDMYGFVFEVTVAVARKLGYDDDSLVDSALIPEDEDDENA